MSRDREAGASPSGAPPPPPLPALPAWPVLPLALLAAALVAALLASVHIWPVGLGVVAQLLLAAGAVCSGAFWARQRQMDRLREARSQLQALGQMVDVWCWQTDADHRLVKLQPPQGAPASAWVAGHGTNEPLWQRFDDTSGSVEPRMRAQAVLGDLKVLHAGTPPDNSARPWRLRGQPRLDGRGRFAGYTGVAWPTEHDDARRQAQQGFEVLLQQAPMALCIATWAGDERGWVMQRANPAACALLKLAAPPNGQQPWALALEGLPAGLCQKVQAMAAGQTLDADGWRVRLDCLGEGNHQRGSAGAVLLLALASTDSGVDSATQSLAAEHAAFSYTISHDLRAPIRVVEGFGRILKEDYGASLDRIGNDHLDRVMGAAARMNQMIDALLSLSRLSTQPLARQSVNLSQMAQWVIDELQRGQPDRQVAVHIAPDLSALGDPTLLRMLLENLLGNAWKYSAKVAQAEIWFETCEQAGRTVFVVRDNGAGFDMRFADRLFGVFQRLHSNSDFQGHGVGLASTRRIVRRHGGEIWAESEVGRGARFYFTLKA